MIPRILIVVTIVIVSSACTVTKENQKASILKKQTLFYSKDFTYQSMMSGQAYITTAATEKMMRGKFLVYPDEKNKVLMLVPRSNDTTDTIYFFPNVKVEEKNDKKPIYEGSTLKYWITSPLVQAISIPLKVRLKTDSFNYELISGFNAGIAIGKKLKHVRYQKQYFPNSTGVANEDLYSEISFTPALFAGLTPIGLKPSNTKNQISADRTVLGLTSGGLLTIGYNKFNLGIAGGFDFPFGSDGKGWIYRGELWGGLVVGLEFIK